MNKTATERGGRFPWGLAADESWRGGEAAAAAEPAKIDGRLARSLRTRAAVLDALIDLVEEGEFKPPAKVIAERSGVSTRSIFQHFPDLETLFSAAVALGVERFAPLVRPVPDDLPLDGRITALARQRADLFEKSGNLYWAGQIATPVSDTLRDTFRKVEYILRVQVEVAFRPELTGLRKQKRLDTVARIAAVGGFHSWYGLRRIQRLTPRQTRNTMAVLIRSLLPE
ncbi:TetR/AcrR family transcriptional regulator [Zavarzinia compransoris]|uniref:TetR/AcrR family transcriptional regulator n=1 Tax=Zavarzinia marina TaxID=2911065 RepID=UPI001F17183A|nr:TetR/AcrR family transcriptional regulator [Zavarzinia marina]MCF4164970.1 TetR/AcrR family transcriptional regulator [Zavarzinia marina]